VRIQSHAAAEIRLYHQLGNTWTLNGESQSGSFVQLKCEPGERYVLKRQGL
jgi:hypothetical protein